MKVPSTNDLIQETGKILEVPEIRVWCCSYRSGRKLKKGESGGVYYLTFSTFEKAVAFIETHPEAEPHPLLAFKGKELNLWEMTKE